MIRVEMMILISTQRELYCLNSARQAETYRIQRGEGLHGDGLHFSAFTCAILSESITWGWLDCGPYLRASHATPRTLQQTSHGWGIVRTRKALPNG